MASQARANLQSRFTVISATPNSAAISLRFQEKPSLFLRSLVPEPAGSVSVFQDFSAARYQGERVRLSGFLRSERLAGQASLWITVTDNGGNRTAFDTVRLSATGPWNRQELVVDVDRSAGAIRFGVQMTGAGTLWAAAFRFETVGSSVPLTARKEPENLTFTKP